MFMAMFSLFGANTVCAGYIDQLTKSPRQRTDVIITSDRSSSSSSEIGKTRSTVHSTKQSDKNTRRKSLGASTLPAICIPGKLLETRKRFQFDLIPNNNSKLVYGSCFRAVAIISK